MILLSIEKTFASILAAVLFATGLNAANQIVIKSVALESYMTARTMDEKMEFQTYQFMEGNYHPGNRADPGMEKMTFRDIILDIAVNLQKQNFYPIPEKGKSDLLIVVHWGVTSIQESIDDMLGYTSLEDKMGAALSTAQNAGADGIITSSEMNSISDVAFVANNDISMDEANTRSAYYQARLIGMERAYSERIGPSEEFQLKYLLKDERYFVVLMAYDFQKLQKGERELLWTTRYSIRSTGQSFENAIKDMNLLAGNYFGQNRDGLIMKRITDKTRVKLGKIEVIGTEDTE